MSSKVEERSISTALGSIPRVHNQRSFSATVTIAGTGIADITVEDVRGALSSQHTMIQAGAEVDQMYVHEIRAFGSGGGYLSICPYPHRQYSLNPVTGGTDVATWFNSYGDNQEAVYRKGGLTQMYEFGINGSTRPELTWTFPKDEVLNNPFTIASNFVKPILGAGTQQINNDCKLLTIQSSNTSGDALYIVQFDVTIRDSRFIEIVPSLGAAAFGEKNVTTDNYKAPLDQKLKTIEGEKAHELANKKRKIENVKALTMPSLDSH